MPPKAEVVKATLRLLVLTPSASNVDTDGIEDDAKADRSRLPLTHSLFATFLRGLTGVEPSADLISFTGYTDHPPLRLRTRYYAADVSLWCDELPTLNNGEHDSYLQTWRDQMLSDEAREVREVLGGIVLLLPYAQVPAVTSTSEQETTQMQMQYVQAISEVRDCIEDESGRDVAAVVAVQDMTPQAQMETEVPNKILAFVGSLEDSCISEHGIFGWDIVAWKPHRELSQNTKIDNSGTTDNSTERDEDARNQDGEKSGMPRILEVFQQTDWSASTTANADDAGYDLASIDEFLGLDDDLQGLQDKPRVRPLHPAAKDGVITQSDEFQREIMGLHFALQEQSQRETSEGPDAGDDIKVAQLSGLMDRAVAIKEAGAEMSKSDREVFAKREIARLMKDMRID